MKGQIYFNGNDYVDDLDNLVKSAIKRLQAFEPNEGYYLAFSGGKDSCVIKALADMAEVKYDAHYSITTVDPPELTKFVKKTHPDVELVIPEINMWDLIIKKKMPPTRMVRYCCSTLKEEGGQGRTVITGVRWAESSKRKNTRSAVEMNAYGSKSKKAISEREKFYLLNDNDSKRKMMEVCTMGKGKHIINPIIEWEDEHVWGFIKKYNIPYCILYDQGFKRLGCLGCPLQGKKMVNDFIYAPYIFKQYLIAFHKMQLKRKENDMHCDWKDGHEVMKWWINMSENEYQKLMTRLEKEMIEANKPQWIKYTKLDYFNNKCSDYTRYLGSILDPRD